MTLRLGPGSHRAGDIERNSEAVLLAGLTPSTPARAQTSVRPPLDLGSRGSCLLSPHQGLGHRAPASAALPPPQCGPPAAPARGWVGLRPELAPGCHLPVRTDPWDSWPHWLGTSCPSRPLLSPQTRAVGLYPCAPRPGDASHCPPVLGAQLRWTRPPHDRGGGERLDSRWASRACRLGGGSTRPGVKSAPSVPTCPHPALPVASPAAYPRRRRGRSWPASGRTRC